MATRPIDVDASIGFVIELSIAGIPPDQLARSTYFTFGSNKVQVREFDADSSLIAPPQLAWQIISRAQPLAPELSRFFAGAEPQATAETVAERQKYDLYHFDLGSRVLAQAQLARQIAAVPITATIRPIRLPVRFGTTLDLIGFDVMTSTTRHELTLMTYWQVNEPTDRPLQLFVHALDDGGHIDAQQDGFGAPSTAWRAGDVIVQVTHLNLPDRVQPGTIEIGWYDQASLQRLPLNVAGQSVGDTLWLAQ